MQNLVNLNACRQVYLDKGENRRRQDEFERRFGCEAYPEKFRALLLFLNGRVEAELRKLVFHATGMLPSEALLGDDSVLRVALQRFASLSEAEVAVACSKLQEPNELSVSLARGYALRHRTNPTFLSRFLKGQVSFQQKFFIHCYLHGHEMVAGGDPLYELSDGEIWRFARRFEGGVDEKRLLRKLSMYRYHGKRREQYIEGMGEFNWLVRGGIDAMLSSAALSAKAGAASAAAPSGEEYWGLLQGLPPDAKKTVIGLKGETEREQFMLALLARHACERGNLVHLRNFLKIENDLSTSAFDFFCHHEKRGWRSFGSGCTPVSVRRFSIPDVMWMANDVLDITVSAAGKEKRYIAKRADSSAESFALELTRTLNNGLAKRGLPEIPTYKVFQSGEWELIEPLEGRIRKSVMSEISMGSPLLIARYALRTGIMLADDDAFMKGDRIDENVIVKIDGDDISVAPIDSETLLLWDWVRAKYLGKTNLFTALRFLPISERIFQKVKEGYDGAYAAIREPEIRKEVEEMIGAAISKPLLVGVEAFGRTPVSAACLKSFRRRLDCDREARFSKIWANFKKENERYGDRWLPAGAISYLEQAACMPHGASRVRLSPA